MLFVLVICVFMLNLVLTNCYAMHYNIRKAIQLQGADRRSGNVNHPVISTGNTYQQIYPSAFQHYLLSSTGRANS